MVFSKLGDLLMAQQALLETSSGASLSRPRLGHLGVGWIGRHRMQAILGAGAIDIAAIADPSPDMAVQLDVVKPGLFRETKPYPAGR
jgi:hypothetical protein